MGAWTYIDKGILIKIAPPHLVPLGLFDADYLPGVALPSAQAAHLVEPSRMPPRYGNTETQPDSHAIFMRMLSILKMSCPPIPSRMSHLGCFAYSQPFVGLGTCR